jgi:hypothetical protein
MPTTRLSRRAGTARESIRQQLVDLACRRSSAPLGRYEIAAIRAALASAVFCLSRQRGPFIPPSWGEAPVDATEAVGLLRAADAALKALSPLPAPPSGRRRNHEMREIPEHYGYHAKKSRN